MWNLEIEIWKRDYLHIGFFYVFLAGNSILVKSLTYILLANIDFLGKNIRRIARNFPLKCYIERSLSPQTGVSSHWPLISVLQTTYLVFYSPQTAVFSHLTTYFCLLPSSGFSLRMDLWAWQKLSKCSVYISLKIVFTSSWHSLRKTNKQINLVRTLKNFLEILLLILLRGVS